MPDVTPDDDNDGVRLFHDPLEAYEWRWIEPNTIEPTHRAFTTLRAEQLLAIEKAARDSQPSGFVCEVCHESEDGGCACCRAAGEEHMRRYHALRPAAPGTPE